MFNWYHSEVSSFEHQTAGTRRRRANMQTHFWAHHSDEQVIQYRIVVHNCYKSIITMPAVCLMLKWNHIKIIIIEHHTVRLSFSIINPGGFSSERKSYINIISKYIISSIILISRSFFILKGLVIARQGITHPWAVSATLPAVSPVFVSYSLFALPQRLLRRGFSAATPSAFLSCLRLIETPTEMMVIRHIGEIIIIISKMMVSFR